MEDLNLKNTLNNDISGTINSANLNRAIYEQMAQKITEAINSLQIARSNMASAADAFTRNYHSEVAKKKDIQIKEIINEIDYMLKELQNEILTEVNLKVQSTEEQITNNNIDTTIS